MKRKGMMAVSAAMLLAGMQLGTGWWSPAAARAESSPLFAVYVPTNMDKILRDDPVPQQAAPVLQMAAARNEYEGGQVIVHAGDQALSRLQVSISELKQEGGSAKIGKDQIELFTEHYIQITKPTTGAYPAGWYPDALVPLNGTLQVEAGRNQGIYVKVHVPKGLPAGNYTGEITLHETGNPVRIPISFTVWDFELTDESHVETAFTLWGDQVAAAHGGVEGEAYWSLLDKYYWASVEERLTPSYLPVPTGDVEEFVRRAEPYIKNPKVSAYRLPVYTKTDGSIDVPKIKALVDLLRSKGLLDKAYFYPSMVDEPGPARYPQVVSIAEQLREAAPDVRSFNTTQPVDELTGSVHSWVALVNKYDESFAHQLQASGDHVWWYTSVVPKDPFPTYHTDDDLLGSRLLSWEQKDYGVEGTLYWSTTIFQKWNGQKYVPRDVWNDPIAFPGANGDGYLFYPGYDLGIDGPVPTLRLENLREGAEDYEYLWRLEQLVKQTAASLGLGDEFAAHDVLQPFFDELYTNMRDYPEEPEHLLEVRKEVAGLIAQLAEDPQGVPLVTVRKPDESSRTFSVYTAKGVQVQIDGELLEASDTGAGYDKFERTLTLEPGMHEVEIAVTKDGETKTSVRKLQVAESYPYAAPLNEADSEVDVSRWTKTGVTLHLTDAFSTSGGQGLQADFASGVKFPNIRLFGAGTGFASADWSSYGALQFDVRNPNPDRTAVFYVKFHQTNGSSDDTHFVSVPAGQTRTITVPLREVRLDLTQMKGIELWMFQLEQPFSLYFDSFRLTSKTPGGTMVPGSEQGAG
ncbi:glycoside hydrolase domain-containing protein [Paenibacillus favisporus]|uniref:DUF4091 domain-containing protein n=1 Tax=Paenibacillus favisporus TaxID=221028 RepID=UPI003D2D1988